MNRNRCSAGRRASGILSVAAVLAALGVTAPAFSQTVSVSAQCNIYGAGHATPPQSCGNPGPGPGVLPVQISLPPNAILVTFSDVSGTFSFCGGGCISGPDGNQSESSTLEPLGGISGITTTHIRALTGVFLSDAEPAGNPPPSLTISDLSFEELSPLIAQQFLIGDGRTGTGNGLVQQFFVPPGATRLFLGFADGLLPCVGWYGDNSGSVSATVSAITPSRCDPDVNQDGNSDQGDVDYIINVVAGGPNPTGIDPDINQDGNLDQGDIEYLINIIASGACP